MKHITANAQKLTVPLRIKLPSRVVRLHPDILNPLLLLSRLSFLSDLDHPLDSVYEEDGHEDEGNF